MCLSFVIMPSLHATRRQGPTRNDRMMMMGAAAATATQLSLACVYVSLCLLFLSSLQVPDDERRQPEQTPNCYAIDVIDRR